MNTIIDKIPTKAISIIHISTLLIDKTLNSCLTLL